MRDIGLWVWNRGEINKVIPPVKRLADICRVPLALDWYWWHHNPYDTGYPDFWPPREGERNFKKAIAELKEHGISTHVYSNGVCWDMDGDSWSQGGEKSAIIKHDGEIFHETYNKYNNHRLASMCGEAPEFHDRLSYLAWKLRSSGLAGQYLDMIGCVRGDICYNPLHCHNPGGGNYMTAGYRELLQRLKKENPEFMLSTEYANEACMDILDAAIVCNSISAERMGIPGEIIPLFISIYHEQLTLFGSYASPDGIPPWDSLWPSEDRWQDEKAWHKLYPDQFFIEMARPSVWGIQPMVCNISNKILDNPEFSEHCRFIIDTARFYYANREYLFDGEMLSPEGFQCDMQEVKFMQRMIFTRENEHKVVRKKQACILHSCWKSPAGEEALIMVNYSNRAQKWTYKGRTGIIYSRSWEKINLTSKKRNINQQTVPNNKLLKRRKERYVENI